MGMGIGYKPHPLSTVGVLGPLSELVKQNVTPNLALSLHAPNDRIREEVVPTMKNVKLMDLIKAGYEYRQATGKNVTFEYVLIEGVNDDTEARAGARQEDRGHQDESERDPLQPVDELGYKAPPQAVIDRFVTALGKLRGSCHGAEAQGGRGVGRVRPAEGPLRHGTGPDAERGRLRPGLPASYFVGAIPSGYVLVRLKTGKDVRTMGRAISGRRTFARVLARRGSSRSSSSIS